MFELVANRAKITAGYLFETNIRTVGTHTYSGTHKELKIKKGIGTTVNFIE